MIRNMFLKSAVCAGLAFPVLSYAGTLYVNCNGHRGLTQIQKAINLLQQQETSGPTTILVSGSCKENITIQSMDNLTLTAQNGASITDASNGTLNVIDIVDSRRVVINGFTITGGMNGVRCSNYSLCRFSANIIRSSLGTGVFAKSSQVSFEGDTLQNHPGSGLGVANGSQVGGDSLTVQGNGNGVLLVAKGALILTNSAVQGNHEFGIRAVEGSTIRVIASIITANLGNGVELDQSTQARFEGFTAGNGITNNGSAGVYVGNLSFAEFDVNSNVTGNAGGTDVVCGVQYSATQGALANIGGGTTNCVEP